MTQAGNVPSLESILQANEAMRRAELPAGHDIKPQYVAYPEPAVDAATLARPWQTITMKNFADNGQTNVFLDRFRKQHQIRPGESCEFQMENDRIANHLHGCRTDRGCYPFGSPKAGQPFPPHPCRITSITPQSQS
jgi:hypothetical protein